MQSQVLIDLLEGDAKLGLLAINGRHMNIQMLLFGCLWTSRQ